MHFTEKRGRSLGAVAALAACVALGVAARPAAAHSSAAIRPAAATPAAARASLAPVTPAFRRWLDAGVGRLPFVRRGHGLGYVPAPLPAPTVQPAAATVSPRHVLAAGAYPSSYDLRMSGRVSPVRDQLTLGTCWAFATVGSVESSLLTASPPGPYDFSEDNVARQSGFDLDPYVDGGYSGMAAAYFLRWSGPVNESSDAYADSITPPGLTAVEHVQGWLRIPQPTTPLANDAIKAALMEHGAIDAPLFYDSSNLASVYKASTAAYYYSGTTPDPNHEIDIVGWDDGYPKTDFATQPPADGAYLCRNSWGAAWGRQGYFWVSYYDKFITTGLDVFTDVQPVTNYSRVYQYDTLGETDDLSLGSTTSWMANCFTAAASEDIAAVGLWVPSGDATYAVSAGPSLDQLTQLTTGTAAFAGFQTITLPATMSVTQGQSFVVAVRLTTPGYNKPIPIEYPFANYSSRATASAGQSYVSSDGKSWTDLTSIYSGTNVCLKAYAAATPPGPDTTPPFTSAAGAWHRTAVTLTFNAVDSGGSGVKTTEYRVDGEVGWHDGTSVTVAAPSDHSNDGVHEITYRSTDALGNVEPERRCSVRIDTVGPRCAVAVSPAAVRAGRRVKVVFRVDDALSPQAHVVLVVRRLNGRLAKRVDLGMRSVGAPLSCSLRSNFGRGRFVVRLARATTDLAGNHPGVTTTRRLRVLR
jgi:C1A family cysteine protease